MKLLKTLTLGIGAALICAGAVQAETQVIPMGTLKYDPAKTFNSYVILSPDVPGTAKLIDRNGNLVKEWDCKGGYGMPNKVYPGGYLLTSLYPHLSTGSQDQNTVALLDWDGKIVRQFGNWLKVEKGEAGQPANADGSFSVSRQHHDYQLEGDPVGYYGSNNKAKLDGNMMVLAHSNVEKPRINKNVLLDDAIYIIDKDDKVIWEWKASDHFVEFGFTQEATNAIQALNKEGKEHGGVDWFHINCASWLGPNKWYDAGDKRFHPDNIIADSRNSSHMFIIDHETGNIVWQVAPPFVGPDAKLAPITGVHGTHMISKGLPGEGNILIFDNGGSMAGDLYKDSQVHSWSRVIEYNPITKEKVWEYSAQSERVAPGHFGNQFFFSPFISIAQRLPNGNTLIDEGSCGRVFEVTPKGELVWEYRSPYSYAKHLKGTINYRAYAVPYDYIPQLKKPVETSVTPPQIPLSFIMLPDDNGKVADFKPKLDKQPGVQFEQPWVIQRPAKK